MSRAIIRFLSGKWKRRRFLTAIHWCISAVGIGRSSCSETRNSKLETRNSKLETRNSKLETRNSKLETRFPSPVLRCVLSQLRQQANSSRSTRVSQSGKRWGYTPRCFCKSAEVDEIAGVACV